MNGKWVGSPKALEIPRAVEGRNREDFQGGRVVFNLLTAIGDAKA